MAQKLLGIDLNTLPSTTPTNEPGIEVEDVRGKGGVITYFDPILNANTSRKYSAGAIWKYVKANGTISAGDAVQLDVSVPTNERDWTVIRTSAVDQATEGIALLAMIAGQYGWICINGRFYDANVADAVTAGQNVMSSAVAGRLANAAASATNALAAATGRAIRALTDGSGANLADVYIYR